MMEIKGKLRLSAVVAVGMFFALTASAQEGTTTGVPVTPDYALDILLDKDLGANLSPEAKQILGRPYRPVPAYYTHRDTVFSPALFSPLIFDVSKIERLHLPTEELKAGYQLSSLNNLSIKSPSEVFAEEELKKRLDGSPFSRMMSDYAYSKEVRGDLFMNAPHAVHKTYASLPEDRIELRHIEGSGYQDELAIKQAQTESISTNAIQGETIDRKYWSQAFNSSVHFAQNQISENWHRGGFNSLNLNSRIYYNLTYNKDKVKWVNQFEYKLGLLTNQNDAETRKLRISEDVFRVNSNLGISAFKNWYYTLDAQMRTQMLQNITKDDVIATRTFAPIIADAGLGMKYDIDKKNFRGDPFQRFRFSANIAPISATLIYTYTDDIDKGRFGLQEAEKHKIRIGSTVRLNLNWDFSDILTWSSRFFYNTSYSSVETEFENRVTYAFSKHLTATFNVILRFDDSVILDEPKTFSNLLQYNELFSFGFEYKF
ncbi:MAG: DUF3078 domain-containing protein [Porphyromonas sp.]|nr:DUF3078 domain-containing protein [Porphyromonas sp.]